MCRRSRRRAGNSRLGAPVPKSEPPLAGIGTRESGKSASRRMLSPKRISERGLLDRTPVAWIIGDSVARGYAGGSFAFDPGRPESALQHIDG